MWSLSSTGLSIRYWRFGARSRPDSPAGGNCDATRPGETIDLDGVTVAGPLNLASSGAVHASEMYARNVFNFASLLIRDGALAIDWQDELLLKTVWPERAADAGGAAPA